MSSASTFDVIGRRMGPIGDGAEESDVGVDVHGLNFLRFAHSAGDFGATVTIGRQSIHIDVSKFGFDAGEASARGDRYAELLLQRYFGATRVDSIDYSAYEGATILHDMNVALPADLCGRWDTVIDLGTTEHVFEAVTALRNASALLRNGGQIVHVLPANNLCGHGFWQFSPELFFSLYTPANGYSQLDVFFAELDDPGHWHRAAPPSGGQRVTLMNKAETYIMVRAVKTADAVVAGGIQQSDYVVTWDQARNGSGPGRKARAERLRRSIRKRTAMLRRKLFGPLSGHPFLTRLKVSTVIGAGGAR